MTEENILELVHWGDAELEQFHLDEAESAYERALKHAREVGVGVELALDGLMRLACRYVMLGFLGKPQALHMYFLETDQLQLSRDLRLIAALREAQGDIDGTEMIMQRILELKLEHLGPSHGETLTTLQDAAMILQTRGKSAEPLYKLAFSPKYIEEGDDLTTKKTKKFKKPSADFLTDQEPKFAQQAASEPHRSSYSSSSRTNSALPETGGHDTSEAKSVVVSGSERESATRAEPVVLSADERESSSPSEPMVLSADERESSTRAEPLVLSADERQSLTGSEPVGSSADERESSSPSEPVVLSADERKSSSRAEPGVSSADERQSATQAEPVVLSVDEPDTSTRSEPLVLSADEPDTSTRAEPLVLSADEPDTSTRSEPLVLSVDERESSFRPDVVLPERESLLEAESVLFPNGEGKGSVAEPVIWSDDIRESVARTGWSEDGEIKAGVISESPTDSIQRAENKTSTALERDDSSIQEGEQPNYNQPHALIDRCAGDSQNLMSGKPQVTSVDDLEEEALWGVVQEPYADNSAALASRDAKSRMSETAPANALFDLDSALDAAFGLSPDSQRSEFDKGVSVSNVPVAAELPDAHMSRAERALDTAIEPALEQTALSSAARASSDVSDLEESITSRQRLSAALQPEQHASSSTSKSRRVSHADADKALWQRCIAFLSTRVDQLANDEQVHQATDILTLIRKTVPADSNVIAGASPSANPDDIDWRILDDLSALYMVTSGTNAGAYELALVYALFVRICNLGVEHSDTLKTLNRLYLMYSLIGLGEPTQFMLSIIRGASEDDLIDVLPDQADQDDDNVAAPEGVIKMPELPLSVIMETLSTCSPDDQRLESLISQGCDSACCRPPEEAISYLTRLLEFSEKLLGEEHARTVSCLFLLTKANAALERSGTEKAFQRVFQLRLANEGCSNQETVAAALEFARSCKVWDDSEQGQLRRRAVAICAMANGLLSVQVRGIIPPSEKRLVHLEFESPPDPGAVKINTTKNKVMLIVDDPQPRTDAERIDILKSAMRELERNRFMSPDFPQIAEAMFEAKAIYAALDSSSKVWITPGPLEHYLLSILLEQQALKEYDRSNYRESLQVMDTVLRIRNQVLRAGHPDLALVSFRRAVLYGALSNFDAGEELFLQANDMVEPIQDQFPLLHAAILHGLGTIYFRRSAFVQADRLYRRAADHLAKLTDASTAQKVCAENIDRAKHLLPL